MSEAIRAAYQGERGAFSEAAAACLVPGAATVPFPTFEEMFDAVVRGDADCCVAPIENSLAGSVLRNYDLLLESGLTILGETSVRIVHHLLGAPGATMAGLRRVYSHPVALAQCGRFLRAHPQLEAVSVHDTAGAVRLVMERGAVDECAIASAHAAAIYGASTLAAGVEDHARNFTRFFLLARPGTPLRAPHADAGSRWKTSLFLQLANVPGALHRALGAFAARGIDLAKIESRPIEGRPWEYSFYVDVAGEAREEPVAGALLELRDAADAVRVLGSYPCA